MFFDVTIGGAPAGRIKMELFKDTCPKTAENFRRFCTGEHRHQVTSLCSGGIRNFGVDTSSPVPRLYIYGSCRFNASSWYAVSSSVSATSSVPEYSRGEREHRTFVVCGERVLSFCLTLVSKEKAAKARGYTYECGGLVNPWN